MIYFYNTPRDCGPYKVPLPIQNSYLRDYARNEGIRFALPVTEYIFPDSWNGLNSILRKIRPQDKIVTFSICAIIDIFINIDLSKQTRQLIDSVDIEFIFVLEKYSIESHNLRGIAESFINYNHHRLLSRGSKNLVQRSSTV